MIAFFTITYCVVIWLFFVKMKIKPNPKNVAAAIVIGVVAIGAIVIMWRFAAPNSTNLVVSRYTVQLVPQVAGPVAKIHAEPNVPLKKGVDVLFEIQKDKYQFTVNQITASLAASRKTVEELTAAVRVTTSGIEKSQASMAAAKAELEVAEETERLNPQAVAKIKVTQLTEQYNAALATVEQAKAAEDQAQAALQSAEKDVVSLEAQLANAQFDLDQCTVYAPADGFVTNWQVREGTMAVSFPFAPVGTFVDTSETVLVANFPQNVCKNMKAGDPIELAIKTRPGQVFTGTVNAIIPATGEGQFVTSGQLGSAADLESSGMFVVRFDMDDQEAAARLAIGTAGSVVVYTDTGRPFHIISKVVVRMNAWMYYLNPF